MINRLLAKLKKRVQGQPLLEKLAFCLSGGACFLFLGILSSCSSDNSDLENYIREVKERKAPPLEPLPQFKPLVRFIFPEADGRPSPFEPIDKNKQQNALYAPDQQRKKQPLEAFPLDALKFVGILKEGQTVWALIQQPDTQVTRVSVGAYMGQDYGRVISITGDSLVLEETINTGGMWEKKKTTLHLNTGS